MYMVAKQTLNKFNRTKSRLTLGVIGLLFVVSTISFSFLPLMSAHASSNGTALSPAARISFTFDDSLASTYTNAEPILAKYGLTGTDYAITGCVGMTTTPNTCDANQDTPYMSWAQLQALQNTDAWEVGSHTVDHVCLASSAETDPGDCANPTPLTTAQVDAELANSKAALASNGINATDFAPPYGDYNNNVLAQIAKYYASMRNFQNVANNANTWPNSDYYLQDMTVLEKTDPVSSVEAAINAAIANNTWLVLTFHNIETKPSTNPDNYEYGTTELAQIAAYVQAKQATGLIQSVHVDQGLVTSPINLLANSSFNSGIAAGWTTDAPANVTLNTGDNGSYPDPTNSIKFVSSTTPIHLFSPKVPVTPSTTYILKNFLNVQQITSGEVGFYIDEYNSNGQWISGKWLKQENSQFVEDMNFTYTPTSPNVTQASLQVVVTGNPGITAYLDNSQWFPEESSSTNFTNLVANGTFTNGIADGWTTDNPTSITANSAGNGSPTNPTYSVSLQSGSTSKNGHLFSPKVAVNSTNTYNISSWLNLIRDTNVVGGGEVGFYIDEYNSNGQWISGQYKTGDYTLGANTIGFNYTPSSANVTQASLQIIVVGNSGIQAYLDNVDWYLN
ncbi:MAG TPA: polysaccharide deacetylase family protein [Candidatus Saccharimonadia bacterium]|nr:polysaccharide deacetylase family protein [Candidatus Saccharimonadia bacterium]